MAAANPADDRNKALEVALGQIEKQFGKGSIMRMGENLNMQHRVDLDRCVGPRPGPRRWRTAARPSHRGLRTGVLG
jgi:hypothetical protein